MDGDSVMSGTRRVQSYLLRRYLAGRTMAWLPGAAQVVCHGGVYQRPMMIRRSVSLS